MKRFAITLLIAAIFGVPSLSRPARAQGSEAASPARCPHGIDESKCPFCDPSRVERLGICREHGVPEALCVECRPFLRDAFVAAGDWCDEHATPESQCAVCSPDSAAALAARAAAPGVDLRWRREPSLECSTSQIPVTLSSAAVAETIGLEYATVELGSVEPAIERNAQLAYNANRYARLSARAPGVVARVFKDLGERAEEGEILVTVDSTDLGTAKTDLLLALETAKLWETNAARERGLVEKGVGIERETIEAETRAAEARIAVQRARLRLRNLGLSGERIDAVERDGDTSSLLEIVAPFRGTIVERNTVVGELVDPARPLIALADTGTMWAMVDLFEGDLAEVRTGRTALITLDGLPGQEFPGTLVWISMQVDERTRTVQARVELDNGLGLLRSNMFGRARVLESSGGQALTVPKDAVQWEGCCNIVFVKADDAGITYRPARLDLVSAVGDRYEVAGGLSPGDIVVTRGSFILKNEILKDAVGAGCCEVDFLDK